MKMNKKLSLVFLGAKMIYLYQSNAGFIAIRSTYLLAQWLFLL
jgi:hypothetical protein